ncbi:MAG: membrane protein insertion efficiency factor YidD [Bacteroidales bacterium]|nr:membrane protein insertion efficiency factor YidD [Bacteroidales bacterium]
MLYTDFDDSRFHARNVTYGLSDSQSVFTRFNPVYHVFSGAMYVYQRFVSVQLPTECAFSPSCSEFSRQLIRRFGLIRGILFSADRLMRCNRLGLTGLPPDLFHPNDGRIHETTERYNLRNR